MLMDVCISRGERAAPALWRARPGRLPLFSILFLVLGLGLAVGCQKTKTPPPSGAPTAGAPAKERGVPASPSKRTAGGDAGTSDGADGGLAVDGQSKGPRRALPAGLPPGRLLTVLHTANLRGEYDNHPLGGLARRATLVAETAKALKASGGALLHVDVGDAFLPLTLPSNPPDDPAPDPGEVNRRARLLATGLGKLRLDAFVPGEADLQLGWKTFRSLVQAAKLPVLLANVVDGKQRQPFEGSRIVTVGGIRVGLFGVLDLPEDQRKPLTDAGLVLTDPAAAAQASASFLRHNGAEIVVGLCHLHGGLAAARAMALNVGGVDAFIIGHEGRMLEDPVAVPMPGADPAAGTPVIVEAGERGRFVGQLDFHIGAFIAGFTVPRAGAAVTADGSWLDHQLVRLNEQFLSDPAMSAFLAPYRTVNRQRAARRLPVGLSARTGTDGKLAEGVTEQWTYGTTPGCRLCHAEEHTQTALTAHAFSLQTLERKARNRDPGCLACHSTGFDVPGGTRNVETANLYFGPVGCESCHGPSVVHLRSRKKSDTKLKVPESVCLTCHKNEHSPEPFDYPAALKAVLGPGHGG
ncbi:MAG TPA: multiheme c-type cytochrome [Polyangia bacterium]